MARAVYRKEIQQQHQEGRPSRAVCFSKIPREGLSRSEILKSAWISCCPAFALRSLHPATQRPVTHLFLFSFILIYGSEESGSKSPILLLREANSTLEFFDIFYCNTGFSPRIGTQKSNSHLISRTKVAHSGTLLIMKHT